MSTRTKLYGKNPYFEYADQCTRYLEETGFLKYGSTVPTSVMELMFGVKASDSWEWRGPFLALKQEIEELGYFCSQRGLDREDMKILAPDEVWLHCKKRQEQRKERTDKDHKIMRKTDIAALDQNEKKRHMHELVKLSRTALQLAEILGREI